MTLRELYEEIGGNYQNMMERLRKEERVEKYVLLFLKDNSYEDFLQSMELGDASAAFRAIHTLKGVCMNLSFDSLYEVSSRITECLREGDIISASIGLSELSRCYDKHLQVIRSYAER